MIFRVEVEFGTHDSMHDGETAISFHRVVVEAPDWNTASLTALQMVSCVGPRRNWNRFSPRERGEVVHESGMPTACYYVE